MHPALTPGRRNQLRASAHPLKPVVIIGDKGLTDTVIAEIERALSAHELIKVKAASDDRGARAAWMDEICGRLGAHPVQAIGKILVVYREKPLEEKAAPEPPKPSRKATGTSRRQSRIPSPRQVSEPRRRRPRTSR